MKHLITFLAFTTILLCGTFATANAQDTQPPVIWNKTITGELAIRGIWGDGTGPHNCIRLEWKHAKDNKTGERQLKYYAYLKKKEETWSQARLVLVTDVPSIGTPYCSYKDLEADTEYEFWVEVRDQAGNESTYDVYSFRTWKVDMELPTIPDKTIYIRDVSEAENETLSFWVCFKLATDDVTPEEEIRYDGTIRDDKGNLITGLARRKKILKHFGGGLYGAEINYSMAGEITGYASVGDTYIITLVAVDGVNYKSNYTPLTYTFTGPDDMTPPTTANPTPFISTTSADQFTVEWEKASDNKSPQSALRYRVNYRIPGDRLYWTPYLTDVSSYTVTGLEPNTSYEVWVEVYDEADNESVYNTITVKTDEGTPTVETRTATYISGFAATLNGRVLADNGSAVTKHEFAYRKKGTGSYTTVAGTASDQFFTADLNALERNTEYEYYAIATNGRGTTNGSTRTFTTLDSGDTERPTISNPTLTIVPGNTSIDVSWTKATDNITAQKDLTYEVYAIRGITTIYTSERMKDINSHTIPNLERGRYYYVGVLAFDEAGNKLGYDREYVTTTGAHYAPTQSNPILTLSNITPTGLTISWTKATDDYTPQEDLKYTPYFIAYSTGGKYYMPSEYDIDTYTFTDLTPGATYLFGLEVEDEWGKIGLYYTKSEKLPTIVADTEGPVPSGSLSFSGITHREITVSWTKATDDMTPQADIEYSLYWSSDDGATSSAYITGDNTYTATGLDSDTEYTFTLQANDEAGNVNVTHAGWTGKKARTLDPGDLTAPTLANADVTVGTITHNSIALSWTKASDNVSAVNKLSYNVLWYPEGDITALDDVSGQIDIASYTITGLKAETKYCIQVSVCDEAGNTTSYNPATGTTTAASVIVNVIGITLNKTTLSLEEGASETLTATVAPTDATNKNVTWKSSNTAVATVNASGKVTAVKAGTATITATTEDGGKTATCAVTVTEPEPAVVPVTGVTLNKTTLELDVDDSETLIATIAPTDATNKNVTWKSDDPTVATVSFSGEVTAIAIGTTTITVTTVDGGKTATCKVTVIDSTVGVEQVNGAEVKAYIIGDILYVSSPKTERIDLYNITGLCLHTEEKPNGEVQLKIGGIPQGVLIVRGSSGWVKKIMR